MRQLVLLISILFLCWACSRQKAALPERQFVTPMTDVQGAADSSLAGASALAQGTQSACDRLSELSKEQSRESFSFIHRLEKKGKDDDAYLKGAINIQEAPIVQLFLGEKFQVPSDEDFDKAARAECAAGKQPWYKCATLWIVRQIDRVDWVKPEATGGKIEEAFPGVFGGAQDVRNSLFFSLIAKSLHLDLATTYEKFLNDEVDYSVLRTRTPQFSGDGWQSFQDDIKKSLQAAIHELDTNDSREKLCSLVLWHRAFTQLVRFKGYSSPAIDISGQTPKIAELSLSNPDFKRVSIPGVFGLALSDDQIHQYDPNKNLFTLKNATSMTEALAWLQGVLYFYEATHPAASWFENTGYPLGDIFASDNQFILPAESHALALGLFVIEFQNIALQNIKKINDKDRLLQTGEDAAGIVLLHDQTQNTVALQDVLQLTKIAMATDSMLEAFSKQSADYWHNKNSMYTQDKLDKLVVLQNSVQQLFFPLAKLAIKLAEGQGSCAAVVDWNLQTGTQKALQACDQALFTDYKQTLAQLGQHTHSSLLTKKTY